MELIDIYIVCVVAIPIILFLAAAFWALRRARIQTALEDERKRPIPEARSPLEDERKQTERPDPNASQPSTASHKER